MLRYVSFREGNHDVPRPNFPPLSSTFPTCCGKHQVWFWGGYIPKTKGPEISKSILQRTSGEPNSESSVHHSSFSWAILPKDLIPNQNTKGTLLCHTGQSSPVYPLQSSLAAFRTLQCCGMSQTRPPAVHGTQQPSRLPARAFWFHHVLCYVLRGSKNL